MVKMAEEQRDPYYRVLQEKVLQKALVYARMSPDEKALLIKQLKSYHKVMVGMCGDGANDCAALKTASVGISLSEAEASIAAPFTSKVQDISCVVDLFRFTYSSNLTLIQNTDFQVRPCCSCY